VPLAAQLDGQLPDLTAAHANLTEPLDMLTDPQEIYRQSIPSERQALNRAFFSKST
jgi:hypothetical protein